MLIFPDFTTSDLTAKPDLQALTFGPIEKLSPIQRHRYKIWLNSLNFCFIYLFLAQIEYHRYIGKKI